MIPDIALMIATYACARMALAVIRDGHTFSGGTAGALTWVVAVFAVLGIVYFAIDVLRITGSSSGVPGLT